MSKRKIITNKDSGRAIYSGGKPLQKVSESKKRGNDKEWAKDCIDYYAGISNDSSNTNRKEEMYKWYSNDIPEEAFHNVVNPLNTTKDKYKNFPAKIKPFNIIRNIIDLLFSEYRKRPFSYQVTVDNPDAVNAFLGQQYDFIMEQLQAAFVEQFQAPTQDPEEQKKREAKFNKAIEKQNHDYKDERAVQGQFALDYIMKNNYVNQILNEAFLDWLTAGEVITYKEVRDEEMFYTDINPVNCTFDTSERFIEDGEFFSRNEVWSLSKVIEHFYKELSPSDIDELEKGTYSGFYIPSFVDTLFDDYGDVSVTHTVWKSFKKIGILKYVDLFGQPQEDLVPEEYKALEGEEVEWIWVNEVWEGWRLNNDIYLRMRPVPHQRNEMNNLAACKLPYNGRRFGVRNSKNISPTQLLIPYQVLYIIIMYTIELTLAKNKGKILLMDKSVIPNSGDWDVEKFFYYAEALGFAIVDKSQPGADKTMNQYQAVDMSTLNHVSELINMAEYVKTSAQGILGITPQRLGNVSNSAQVGATQRAVFQSSIISENVFGRYDEFVERELRGLLDISKLAWRNGKKALFIGDEARSQILDVDPVNYVASDFGVIATNNTKDQETLDNMKQLAHAFAQNGQSPIAILEMFNANNISHLRNIMKDLEKKQQDIMDQQREAESQQSQQQQQAMQQLEELKKQFEFDKINLEWDRKDQHEQVKAGLAPESPEVEDNTLDIENAKREIERGKIDNEKSLNERKLSLEERRLAIDGQKTLLDAQVKKYDSDNKVRIAKENKNRFDK